MNATSLPPSGASAAASNTTGTRYSSAGMGGMLTLTPAGSSPGAIVTGPANPSRRTARYAATRLPRGTAITCRSCVFRAGRGRNTSRPGFGFVEFDAIDERRPALLAACRSRGRRTRRRRGSRRERGCRASRRRRWPPRSSPRGVRTATTVSSGEPIRNANASPRSRRPSRRGSGSDPRRRASR